MDLNCLVHHSLSYVAICTRDLDDISQGEIAFSYRSNSKHYWMYVATEGIITRG